MVPNFMDFNCFKVSQLIAPYGIRHLEVRTNVTFFKQSTTINQPSLATTIVSLYCHIKNQIRVTQVEVLRSETGFILVYGTQNG